MKYEAFIFLFPTDPLDIQQVDPEYEKEYLAAKKYCDVALIQLELLLESGNVKINRSFPEGGTVVYRGWMLTPMQYQILENWMMEQNAHLFTSLSNYTQTHLLPSWGNRSNTLQSKWTDDLSRSSLIRLLGEFNSAITVKDFVKSRKHEWEDAFFIPDSTDIPQALSVINTFIERQGEQLVGGVVLREFIELKEIGRHPRSQSPIFEEYRVFYWQATPIVIIDYWHNESIHLNQQELDFISEQGRDIASPFFTIDYARKATNELIIMEIGDGQVSGLQEYEEELFYKKLFEEITISNKNN